MSPTQTKEANEVFFRDVDRAMKEAHF